MGSQLLCNASCYERIATSNANADLKQPLVVVQDLESSRSSSSSPIEQNADIARQRMRILSLVKNFCFGAFTDLLLHAATFSTFWVIYKKLGKTRRVCPLSYWTLYLLSNTNIAFCTLIWLGFVMMVTRKGPMYMRRKFDNDADTPNSESISTARFLLLAVEWAFTLASFMDLMAHVLSSISGWACPSRSCGCFVHHSWRWGIVAS